MAHTRTGSLSGHCLRWALAFALVISASLAHAQANRVALVISNSSYTVERQLANPANDAKLVRRSLEAVGFKVIPAPEVGVESFRRALKEFRAASAQAEVAIVYYAGHGIEARGENWLIPVDAKLSTELDLPDEAINLQRVFDSLQGAKLRVVILDACRNNPFGRQWRAGSRSVSKGLSGLAADDFLVIYAAAPGAEASDGTGGNSPFALALAERLKEVGLPVQNLGNVVRDDVLQSTSGQQRPYVASSITGTYYYLAGQGAAGADAALPAKPKLQAALPPASGQTSRSEARSPTTPLTFTIVPNGAADANFRQARTRLRDGIALRGLVWTPQERDADIAFQLTISVVRTEQIGVREAAISLEMTCKIRRPGGRLPRGNAFVAGKGHRFELRQS